MALFHDYLPHPRNGSIISPMIDYDMTNKDGSPAPNHPVILCILDGWGNGSDGPTNAIARAATPTWDRLVASNPHSHLQASAHFVGLPDGQMGNSKWDT